MQELILVLLVVISVLIGYIGEKPAAEPPALFNRTAGYFRIDVNTATWEELDLLPGIGEKSAKAIVSYRTEHGYFRELSDLLRIKGINERLLNKTKNKMVVNKNSATSRSRLGGTGTD